MSDTTEQWNITSYNTPFDNNSAFELNETTSPDLTSSTTSLCDEEVTTKTTALESSHDAFLYIVVVLLFYALSMVILMVKYIRRERQEAEMDHYYSEYVSRDHFKAPMFEIKRCMNKIMGSSVRMESVTEDNEEFVSCLDISDIEKNALSDSSTTGS